MKTKAQALATIRQLSDQIMAHAKKYEVEAAVMFLDQEKPETTLYQDFNLSMFGAMVELNLVLQRFGLSAEKAQEIRDIVEAELQRHASLIPSEVETAQ